MRFAVEFLLLTIVIMGAVYVYRWLTSKTDEKPVEDDDNKKK